MAAIGTLPVLFATGNHASRPAASAVGKGGLYSCTTHSLVYQTDGSSWSTWASLTGTGLADPMTTRGDIIVRDASNVTNRLAIGASRKMLKSDGTDAAYGFPSRIGCKVTHSTTQSTTTTPAAVAFNSETGGFDSDAFHDTSSDNSRITVPSGFDGTYLVSATVEVAASTPHLGLYKNGTKVWDGNRSTGVTAEAHAIIAAVATDYFQVFCDISTGTQNIASGNNSPWFAAILLGV